MEKVEAVNVDEKKLSLNTLKLGDIAFVNHEEDDKNKDLDTE